MTKRIVFAAQAQADLAALGQPVALRILRAINRFARTGLGDVKRLQGIQPPEFRLRSGDWRVRFRDHGDWIDVLRIRNRKDAYR